MTYCLVLKAPVKQILEIGQKGLFTFDPGYYAYVGSAKKNGYARVNRHWLKGKKLKWHIDFLRKDTFPKALYLFDQSLLGECQLASIMATEFIPILGFGASDCHCPTHLFYNKKATFMHKFLGQQKGLLKVFRPNYQKMEETL